MLRKIRFLIFVMLIITMLCACAAQPKLPDLPEARIARHPEPIDYSWINPNPTEIPAHDPDSIDPFRYDFRSSDLKNLNLSASINILNLSNFDSKTQWPQPEKLPSGFSVEQVMEMGKDPGLGIRELHKQGITGKGIGIAIIDQTLLVDHQEYVNQIRVYEEGEDVVGGWLQSSMHGAAVASIAAGKTAGVAPDADLYFIAHGSCHKNVDTKRDFSCLAKDVMRIIEINKSLPEGRKIRILSMSIGWSPEEDGYQEITDAVEKAKNAGIFVVSSSVHETYGFRFHGMGRNFQDDPNNFEVYQPGQFWAKNFYSGKYKLDQTLLIPMDARTTASPTGTQDYVYYGQGGWSWSIPYVAGMYALACQVKPDVTPQEFWSTALQTGRTIQVDHNGEKYSFGVILDPQALIAALQK